MTLTDDPQSPFRLILPQAVDSFLDKLSNKREAEFFTACKMLREDPLVGVFVTCQYGFFSKLQAIGLLRFKFLYVTDADDVGDYVLIVRIEDHDGGGPADIAIDPNGPETNNVSYCDLREVVQDIMNSYKINQRKNYTQTDSKKFRTHTMLRSFQEIV